MRTMLAGHAMLLMSFALATMPGVPDLAEIKATATRSLTVPPAGPRPGESGGRYFNVESTRNERYASLGVLIFEPQGVVQVGDVGEMSQ